MTPLKIEHLTKYYNSLLAVDNVDFTIEEGEIFGLLGPNGAGKTSIISMITTLQEPTSGSITVFGHDVMKEPQITKSLLGCVPQELVNHGFFTVEEILVFHSGYYGISNNRKQIDFLIRMLDLSEHRKKKVKELSGGMKRRLLIAKALVHQPKLLLLDEPTAGVDIELRFTLWNFVRQLRDSGTSILLTTHYLEEAEHLCNRVAFMNKGRLAAFGKTKELIDRLSMRRVTFFVEDVVPDMEHPYLTHRENGRFTFEFPAAVNVGEFLAELPIDLKNVRDLAIREGRLEDAFQRIMREA